MDPTTFNHALIFTLRWEGGYVNNPADHGGATMHGVTQRVYNEFRAHHGHPAKPVRQIADAELHQIYHDGYWAPIRGDMLPPPVGIATFDAAVNSGPKRAIKWLQKSLGLEPDGVFGPATFSAVKYLVAPDKIRAVAERCIDARESFLRSIAVGDQEQFLKGWLHRTHDLRTYIG
jgi:lysozyme family protein